MKWFKRKAFLATLGYSLAITAWFSYSSLFGLDMLSYTKGIEQAKGYKSGFFSSISHK